MQGESSDEELWREAGQLDPRPQEPEQAVTAAWAKSYRKDAGKCGVGVDNQRACSRMGARTLQHFVAMI